MEILYTFEGNRRLHVWRQSKSCTHLKATEVLSTFEGSRNARNCTHLKAIEVLSTFEDSRNAKNCHTAFKLTYVGCKQGLLIMRSPKSQFVMHIRVHVRGRNAKNSQKHLHPINPRGANSGYSSCTALTHDFAMHIREFTFEGSRNANFATGPSAV